MAYLAYRMTVQYRRHAHNEHTERIITVKPRRFTAAFLPAILAAPLAYGFDVDAPSGNYVNDPGHTRLLWKIDHLGLSNYTARMNSVSIVLQFNAEDIARSSVVATIDPRSVDTGFVGDKDFDAEIASEPAILNASRFPEIRFESTGVTTQGDNRLVVKGELTLLGVTLPVTLNTELLGSMASHPFVEVPALGFQATAVIDRTRFGQDFLSGNGLGDTVEIEIQAEFIKQ
jgi:polyisoprenoid-binding protein YceI